MSETEMRVPRRQLPRVSRLFLVVLAAIIVSLGLLPPAGAQRSPEQELAERYAPIAMLRGQEHDCDHEGEGYFPAPVDFLFDNPDIRLMVDAGGDKKNDVVLAEGFTPQDMANAPEGAYLDFPGNPREPGCTYERYFKEKVEELGIRPTTYAAIVVDPVTRRLYLQYWFYYYFNQWNNTHESDWEMLMLVFEGTTSVEEALQFGPSGAAFAQHGGGELSNWTDTKLEMRGDQPIAYPSAGSHATYFGQHHFIGWGEGGTAFGCDDTSPPSVETPLDVIVVPQTIDPDSDLAFFLFGGKWGERDVAVFDSPKGPNLGGKWNDPTEAISNWRQSTLKVPDASTDLLSTTEVFCTISAVGSKAVTKLGTRLPLLLGSAIALIAGVALVSWRVWPYMAEAIDIYGDELRKFLGIGATVIPLGLLSSLVAGFLDGRRPLTWVDQSLNGSTSGSVAVSLIMGSLQQFVMVLLVTPAVVAAMRDIRAGRRPGVFRSYGVALRMLPVTLPALIVLLAIVAIGTLSIVLIPVMIYLIVRLQFFAQAAILEDRRPFTQALQGSWHATRGHWWQALAGGVLFQVFAVLPGPLIGITVLIVGGSRVSFANFLSSFVYALTIPLATIALTMLYHRLSGHEIVENRNHPWFGSQSPGDSSTFHPPAGTSNLPAD